MSIVRTLRKHGSADESGQALGEYALILAFIAVVCVIALTALGIAISAGFSNILPFF